MWRNSYTDNLNWDFNRFHTQTVDTGPMKDHTNGLGNVLFALVFSLSISNNKSLQETTNLPVARWLGYPTDAQKIMSSTPVKQDSGFLLYPVATEITSLSEIEPVKKII